MGMDTLAAVKKRPADRAGFYQDEVVPAPLGHPIGYRRVIVAAEPDEAHQKGENDDDQRHENRDFDDPTPPIGYSVLYGAFVRCRNSYRKSR